MAKYIIQVHPADGSFDRKRDIEVVEAEREQDALNFVRSLAWVKATKATVKVERVVR